MCQTRRVLSPKSTARVFNRCVHAVQKPPFGRIVLCMKFPPRVCVQRGVVVVVWVWVRGCLVGSGSGSDWVVVLVRLVVCTSVSGEVW